MTTPVFPPGSDEERTLNLALERVASYAGTGPGERLLTAASYLYCQLEVLEGDRDPDTWRKDSPEQRNLDVINTVAKRCYANGKSEQGRGAF